MARHTQQPTCPSALGNPPAAPRLVWTWAVGLAVLAGGGFATYKIWQWHKAKAPSGAKTGDQVNLATTPMQSKGYQPLRTPIAKPISSPLPKVVPPPTIFVPAPPSTPPHTNTATATQAVNCWDSDDPWDCGQDTPLTGLAVQYQATCVRTLQLFAAALQPYHWAGLVLEPSAGYGVLAQVAARSCPAAQVHCLEIAPDLVKGLLDKGFAVQQTDFLTFDTRLPYDVICMNPPYDTPADREAWKKHFFKALYLLQPQAVLLCSLPVEGLAVLQVIDSQVFATLQATVYAKLNGGKSLFLTIKRK
jgi:hypothetical protein